MRNNKLYIACFLLGIGIGIYSAAEYYKTKYQTKADSEIESVRLAYRDMRKEKEETKIDIPLEGEELPEPKIEKAKEIIETNRYSAEPGPYIISPDDFGSTFEYDCVSLVYYADGFLVDDNQMEIDDVTTLIGEDALEHFGEYEDDAVHVRNDKLRCDYEILLDSRKWEDVKKKWER